MFVEDTTQGNDRAWTNWNVISETLQSSGTVEFDPPVYVDQCCINNAPEILGDQDSNDGKGNSMFTTWTRLLT